MIGKLLGAVLAIVIGVVFLPVVTESVSSLNATTLEAYPGVAELVNILPLLFVVVIIGGAIAYIKFK